MKHFSLRRQVLMINAIASKCYSHLHGVITAFKLQLSHVRKITSFITPWKLGKTERYQSVRKTKSSVQGNRIVFIFEKFPQSNDPSLLAEIGELKNRGVPLEILSLYSMKRHHNGESREKLEDNLVRTNLRSAMLFLPKIAAASLKHPVSFLSLAMILIRENYNHPAFLARLFLLIPQIAWIAKRLENIPSAILHSEDSLLCASATWMVSRLSSRPYLLGISSGNAANNGSGLKSPIIHAKGMLTRTRLSKTSLLSRYNGEVRSPIWLLYQSMRLEFIPEESERDDEFTILAICTRESKNGFDEFVRACEKLANQRIQFKCALIGEGPTYDKTESQVYDKNLEHMICCLGDLPEHEVIDWMARVDVLVMPDISARKNTYVPTWILKAMAMGLPIIACRGGVIEEVVKDFVSGILVTPGDSISLASAIHTLYYHPETRCQLGSRAKQLVDSRFNLEKNINIMEEIYEVIKN